MKHTLGLVFFIGFMGVPNVMLGDDHDDIKPFKLIPPATRPSTGLLKPFTEKLDNRYLHPVDSSAELNDTLEFKCVEVPGRKKGWWPQKIARNKGEKTAFPPLGREPIPSLEICQQIVESAKNGVVCSNTGVAPFYKPTHFSGSTEARRDFGFWGSSTTLAECLIATRYSSSEKVCYWGGSDWYIGDITGAKRNLGGPFKTVKDCVGSYGADPTQKKQISYFKGVFEK